jgi:hypothetical protein
VEVKITPKQQEKKYVKSSIHAISPYVGKLRPELANKLIHEFSQENNVVLDPFCGSGTIAFESWISDRMPVAIDLNYYAYIVTMAKLNPFPTYNDAIKRYEVYKQFVKMNENKIDLRTIPKWVRQFFHPETLRGIISWTKILLEKKEWFLLACLMGILHHQRPGFLSYPSSHGAPYLRIKKFPKEKFPQLYEYRSVDDRLLAKITRTYKQTPQFDFTIKRHIFHCNTLHYHDPPNKNITIITSPPYMKSLTYARDNRLRLWFLGYSDWKSLDKNISIGKDDFLILMRSCFLNWSSFQKKGDYCILVIGDIDFDKKLQTKLPEIICNEGKERGYFVDEIRDYPISIDRKMEKKKSQMRSEKICILRRG